MTGSYSRRRLPRVRALGSDYRNRVCGHTCDLWVELDLSCARSNCLLCPPGLSCHWDAAAWEPKPRTRRDISDWQDHDDVRRGRRIVPPRIELVYMRGAETGMPVKVERVTWWGRLAMWLRAWREAR